MSIIIPFEVAHNLYRVPNLEKTEIDNLLLKWITQEKIDLINTTPQILLTALDLLKSYRKKGIGGRDCITLASMLVNNIDTIATHDKNILGLSDWNRIDLVFSPPLNLPKGQKLVTTAFNLFK